jgi:hypothetical protein
MYPRVGPNVQKMSPDLIAIVRMLESDVDVEQHTILCGEEVTSFLTPCSPRFTYVVMRTLYLHDEGLNPAQKDASARYFLTLVAQSGRRAEELYMARMMLGNARLIPTEMLDGTIKPPTPSDDLLHLNDVPELLDHYRVSHVITSLPFWLSGQAKYQFGRQLMAERDDLLRELGFREVYSGREHSLWTRHRP